MKASLLIVKCLLVMGLIFSAHASFEKVKTKVTLNKSNSVIETEMIYISNKTLDELVFILDPQNWAKCSTMFYQTYLVDSETLEKIENPPLPGSYWKGILYEDFRPISAFTLTLRNFLNFESIPESMIEQSQVNDSQKLVHEFKYSLNHSINNTFMGFNRNGGTIVDEGHIKIYEYTDGRYLVEGLKDLKVKLGYLPTGLSNKLSIPSMKTLLPKMAEQLLSCDIE